MVSLIGLWGFLSSIFTDLVWTVFMFCSSWFIFMVPVFFFLHLFITITDGWFSTCSVSHHCLLIFLFVVGYNSNSVFFQLHPYYHFCIEPTAAPAAGSYSASAAEIQRNHQKKKKKIWGSGLLQLYKPLL